MRAGPYTRRHGQGFQRHRPERLLGSATPGTPLRNSRPCPPASPGTGRPIRGAAARSRPRRRVTDSEPPGRGDIYRARLDQTRTYLVAIITPAWFNEADDPLVVPIARAHGSDDCEPWMILTGEVDPVTGVLFMSDIAPIASSDLIERVGMLTGPTLSKVNRCLLAILLDLPTS